VTDSATLSTPTSASAAAANPAPQSLDVRAIALLGLGHLSDDVQQSFLPALLPLLLIERHLTYASVASLVLAQGISSSVVQPLIGYIADKRPMPWMAGLGLALAGGGIALIGFMPTFALIFVCALISGLGVAMFHPEAARFANLASGPKKASGMRWFAVGGNIGFAVGPLFATAAIALYGLRGTFLAAVPVAIMATLLLREAPRLRTFLPKIPKKKAATDLPDDWSAFGRLTLFIAIRSMAYIGLVSFIPLYFVHVVHVGLPVANLVLTAFLVAGVAGTLIGGPLADRYGRLIVIWVSVAVSGVCVWLIAVCSAGPSLSAIVAGFVVAVVLGLFITGSQAAAIVLGQEYLPNRLGTASGVTLGLAVSVGGIFSPVLGVIGDRWGLEASILSIAALLALSLAIGFSMPSPAKRRIILAARAAAAP
jgi:FSR family fosmidomycin resistance protein-like MFS transporter